MLIDCSSLVYAAYYTTGFMSYGGKETGIIYGFLRAVLNIAETFKTRNFVFCFDAGVSHRHHIYPKYKANRQTTDEEKDIKQRMLIQQHHLRGGVLRIMGFGYRVCLMHYEADDLLAYYAERLSGGKQQVIMVTTDSDMYQCLDLCDIWFPTTKRMFTRKDFIKKYSIEPAQWPMAKAIGGCKSDHVPGIEGVSDAKNPKSNALKYLRGELGKGKVLDRIESYAGKEIIERNLKLVTLPIYPDLMPRRIIRRNNPTRKGFLSVFDELHFKSFLDDEYFTRWENAFLV